MPKSISFSTFHAGNSCVENVIVFQMYTNILGLVFIKQKFVSVLVKDTSIQKKNMRHKYETIE